MKILFNEIGKAVALIETASEDQAHLAFEMPAANGVDLRRFELHESGVVDVYPNTIDSDLDALLAPAAAPGKATTEVSPVEFKLLFTSEERIALRVARASDVVLQDFFDIAEDPRLTKVELGLESTVKALGYMVQTGFLTAARAAAIGAGQRP